MIGALTLSGTPAGDAVVATVIYRLVTTREMAGIGSLALVFVHCRTAIPVSLTGEAAAIASRGRDDGKADGESAREPGEMPGTETTGTGERRSTD